MENGKKITPNDIAKTLGVEKEYNDAILKDIDEMYETFVSDKAKLFENNFINNNILND